MVDMGATGPNAFGPGADTPSQQSTRPPLRERPLIFDLGDVHSINTYAQRLGIGKETAKTVQELAKTYVDDTDLDLEETERLFFELLWCADIARGKAVNRWKDYHFLGYPVAYFLRIGDSTASTGDSSHAEESEQSSDHKMNDDDPDDEDYQLPRNVRERYEAKNQFEEEQSFYIKNGDVNSETIEQKEVNIGCRSQQCKYCKALLFPKETSAMCCQNGKVKLEPLPALPPRLHHLFHDKTPEARFFRKHINKFNNAFCITSAGMKRDYLPSAGRAPQVFKLQGMPGHKSGPMLPRDGENPQYAQLYLLETRDASILRAEQSKYFKNGHSRRILWDLGEWLKDNNPFAKTFLLAKEKRELEDAEEICIVFEERGPSNEHQRRWNAPSNEGMCGSIMDLDDVNWEERYRDIILTFRNTTGLKRIFETHPHFDDLHYILFFPWGRPHGWSVRDKMDYGRTPRAHYKYRFIERVGEPNYIFRGKLLYQKFLIDMYSKVLMQQLRWLSKNQDKIRGAAYQDFKDIADGVIPNPEQMGKLIILPSTHKGSNRFMRELYHDFMAVVRVHGPPTLFVTMTCNPNWPEIKECLFDNESATDRPGIANRVFQQRLLRMVDDLYKHGVMGRAVAKVYVIEFQKRGLPHAHILIFLRPEDIPHSTDQVDRLVSSEIPDPAVNPKYVYVLRLCP